MKGVSEIGWYRWLGRIESISLVSISLPISIGRFARISNFPPKFRPNSRTKARPATISCGFSRLLLMFRSETRHFSHGSCLTALPSPLSFVIFSSSWNECHHRNRTDLPYNSHLAPFLFTYFSRHLEKKFYRILSINERFSPIWIHD